MRTNTPVLFRGKEQVIEAYTAMDVAAWSMWAGKDQLLFSYSGNDMADGESDLRQALDMLYKGGTTACLTLKVYTELTGKIKSNTPFDNSFGFSLFGLDEESPAAAARTQGYKNLESRIDQLTELVTASMAGTQEEEKPSGIMGHIGAILERPEVQQMIIGGVAGYVRKFFSKDSPAVAAVGKIEEMQQPQGSAWDTLPEDQRTKLQQAMEILMRQDPKIGDHLLSLARIAQNEPSKYQMALNFL